MSCVFSLTLQWVQCEKWVEIHSSPKIPATKAKQPCSPLQVSSIRSIWTFLISVPHGFYSLREATQAGKGPNGNYRITEGPAPNN